MIKIYLFFTLFIACSSLTIQAQNSSGINIGYYYSTFDDDTKIVDFFTTHNLGVNGYFKKVINDKIAFQNEFGYLQKGAKSELKKFKLHTLEVSPSIYSQISSKFAIGTAVYLGYIINREIIADGRGFPYKFKPLDAGVNVIIQSTLYQGKRFNINPFVKGSYGLLDITDDNNTPNIPVSSRNSEWTRNMGLMLGVNFEWLE